ncbi:GMC oxidoreductase [Pseudonocardia sp. H11422]|uniref:GMC oxidoreductase n=1 Tax=Pseudonocardia sp. H11422 TaxID=2835866 RepID=UPI0027E335A5|nr:GMC oxidoreductase [Pseudonocardia sp. H11422]
MIRRAATTAKLRRRTFLGAATVTIGLGVTGGRAFVAPAVSEQRHRAVVIGSGLGGAIAAFRLARAGVQTCVLERGRRWPITPAGDTFPPFLRPDRRSSYLTPSPVFPMQPPAVYRPYTGLFEKVAGDGMSVLCGAGVGGSTLVYAGAWIRPSEAVFTASMPAGIDYTELDRVHYPRAAARVGIAPIPDDVLAHPNYAGTRLFLDQARRAGLPAERVANALDWDVVRAELAGRAVGSVTRGEYFSGVNSGARNSVDRNYLARAEKSGHVSVAPLHRVTGIGADPAGRYRVDVERIDENGTVLERILITADAVFLGAGSTGTSQLLVRARETGMLPELNDQVGRNWGNNGDRIYLRALVPQPAGGPQGGPMAVAIRRADDPADPVTVAFGPAPLPFEAHLMSLPGFGACRPAGEFRYDAGTDTVRLRWPGDGDAAAQRSVRDGLLRLVRTDGTGLPAGVTRALAGLTAGLPGGLRGPATLAAEAPSGLLDLGNLDPVTWHPLGGATLGTACDLFGRVHGHRGLYVTDGALIPGSTGACNPSWTIAAMAERCLDDVVARDVGTVF